MFLFFARTKKKKRRNEIYIKIKLNFKMVSNRRNCETTKQPFNKLKFVCYISFMKIGNDKRVIISEAFLFTNIGDRLRLLIDAKVSNCKLFL